ncbi:MAG: YncE family protein [Oscillospiraceae bacterium]
MGTTLANLHILNGNLEQIKTWIPDAAIGQWSHHCVSVFSAGFLPELTDKKARTLSKQIPQPVLSAWLFDSDAVGISVFQHGKTVAAHIFNPDGYSKMGNIPLFCAVWNLPEEDIPRLRTVWRKGSAEEQLDLTAALLGLPLYHDAMELPDKQYERDTASVDRWIKERPAPPKIKNQAKAELIQELSKFRCYGMGSFRCPFYVSVDPFDDEYAYDRYHLWKAAPDGTVGEIWSDTKHPRFFVSDDRIICVDFRRRTAAYDSSGLLPCGHPLSDDLLMLEDGKTLQSEYSDDRQYSLLCCAPNGAELWRKSALTTPQERVFAWNGREMILARNTKERSLLARIDLADGHEIEVLDRPVGLNAYQKQWHNGAWWITHDGQRLEHGCWTGRGNYQLTKLDEHLRKISEAALPSYTQDIFFSPDGKIVYVFLYQNQVMVIDAERLTVEHILKDKAYLTHLGFDDKHPEPWFWLQRDGSTVEAWDSLLTKPLSRHRLKGEIVGCHRGQNRALCVSTWDKRKNIFRVYRLT